MTRVPEDRDFATESDQNLDEIRSDETVTAKYGDVQPKRVGCGDC